MSRRKLNRYAVDPETGCWVWQLKRGRNGYGYEKRDGESLLAHRCYWEDRFGPIPDGKNIDHLCRNRACVNPDHLEPVTQAENVRRGNRARLTRDQVSQIKTAMQTEGTTSIARRYGVGTSTIDNIRSGKNWKGVDAA